MKESTATYDVSNEIIEPDKSKRLDNKFYRLILFLGTNILGNMIACLTSVWAYADANKITFEISRGYFVKSYIYLLYTLDFFFTFMRSDDFVLGLLLLGLRVWFIFIIPVLVLAGIFAKKRIEFRLCLIIFMFVKIADMILSVYLARTH